MVLLNGRLDCREQIQGLIIGFLHGGTIIHTGKKRHFTGFNGPHETLYFLALRWRRRAGSSESLLAFNCL